MIFHEFAVDPSVFATLDGFKMWSPHFGMEQGRLIADFPSEWKRRVFEAIPKGESPMKRKSLVEKLKGLDARRKLVQLDRTYDPEKKWKENAIDEHSRHPFHAVIVRQNPTADPRLLVADDIDPEEDSVFAVTSGKKVPRRADAMAEEIALLLHKASEVWFVDPYFLPWEERFLRPLYAFLEKAARGAAVKSVQYHFFQKKENDTLDCMRRACKDKILGYIPKGMTVELVVWERKHKSEKGDDPHPRYVLTDVGGVRFDWGLDEDGNPEKGNAGDVQILPKNLYVESLAEYARDSTKFTLLGLISVEGTR